MKRTSSSDLRVELTSYLKRRGWRQGSPGGFGELWQPVQEDSPRLAVPFEVPANSPEFSAIVSRLSGEEYRSAEAIADEIEHEFLDVQAYRIADSFVYDDSVLLESAATVLLSARRLIRVAANTSRKPRASIGSNFSKPADEIADRARLSHTRKGSFVLPVVMPVPLPEMLPNQILDQSTEVMIEPTERRVTRTCYRLGSTRFDSSSSSEGTAERRSWTTRRRWCEQRARWRSSCDSGRSWRARIRNQLPLGSRSRCTPRHSGTDHHS